MKFVMVSRVANLGDASYDEPEPGSGIETALRTVDSVFEASICTMKVCLFLQPIVGSLTPQSCTFEHGLRTCMQRRPSQSRRVAIP